MPYRNRTRQSAKMAKARLREEGEAPDYPVTLPDLRRTIIVVDHDFGDVEHRIDLFKTRRVDCYRVVADGLEWKERMGWSRILAALRKSFLRVRSA